MGGVVIKSKVNKATTVALGLALILIFMMILILFAQSGEGGEGGDRGIVTKVLGVLIIVSAILFFAKLNKRNAPKTQSDIIQIVADAAYKHSAKSLNVLSVNVERGGNGETYVHFIRDYITYLYLEGVGVIETHVGIDIGSVKRERQRDEIAMTVAKDGIASQRNRDKLIEAGLYKEEGELE